MKQEFINFVNTLIEAAPEVAEQHMTENVKAYLDALTDKKNEKPEVTDSGKLILKYLQMRNLVFIKQRILPKDYMYLHAMYLAPLENL